MRHDINYDANNNLKGKNTMTSLITQLLVSYINICYFRYTYK